MPLPLLLRLRWCFWAGYLVCCTAQRGAHTVSLAPFFFFEPLFAHFIASPPAPLHIRANSPKPPPRPAIQLAVSPPLPLPPPPPPQSHYSSSSPPIGRSVALPRWWKRRIYSPRTEVGKREDRPSAAAAAAAAKNRRMKRRRRPETASIAVVVFGQGGGIKKEGVYSAVARRGRGGG